MPNSKNVLILEDEDATRTVLSESMRGAGHKVQAFARPDASCVNALVNGKIDLILMDLGLFNFDAAQIMKFLHAQKVALDIPIIIISGKTPKEIEQSARELKARDWVSKPFKIEDVLAKVRKVLV